MTAVVRYLLAATLVVFAPAGCSREPDQADANGPREADANGPREADRGEGQITRIEDAPLATAPSVVAPATAPAVSPEPEVVILPAPPATAPAPAPEPNVPTPVAAAPATRPDESGRDVVVPPAAGVKPATAPAPETRPAPIATAPAEPNTPPAATAPAPAEPVLVPIPPAAPATENDPNHYIALADRALARDDPNQAIRFMYRAVELNPTRPASLRGLAVALVAAGRFEESLPIYDAILGMDPNDATARFNLALAASRVRDFGRAEREYRALVAKDERHVRAWYNLAMLYQAQARLEDARQSWLRVIELAPKMASAHAFLGEIYMDLRRPGDAMDSLATAVKLDANSAVTWINFAAASKAAGSYGRALAAIDKAAKLAPEDALVHRRRGELLLELHRATEKPELLSRAVAAWKKSLAIEPGQEGLAEKVRRLEPAAATQPAQ